MKYSFLIFLFLVGCTTSLPTIKPVDGFVPSYSADEFIAEKNLTVDKVSKLPLRLLYNVDHIEKGRLASYRYAVLFNPSGELRLEVLPKGFVRTLFLLVGDSKGEAIVKIPTEGKEYAGDIDELISYSPLSIPLTRNQILGVLAGKISTNLSNESDNLKVFYDEECGVPSEDTDKPYICDKILVRDKNLKDEWLFDKSQGNIVKSFHRAKGAKFSSLTVEYKEFIKLNELSFPSKVRFSLPDSEVSLSLSLVKAVYDKKLNPRLFRK